MTMRTPNVELRSTDTLDISSEDATRLELSDGERVTSAQSLRRSLRANSNQSGCEAW